jgi:hypothetical protein
MYKNSSTTMQKGNENTGTPILKSTLPIPTTNKYAIGTVMSSHKNERIEGII